MKSQVQNQIRINNSDILKLIMRQTTPLAVGEVSKSSTVLPIRNKEYAPVGASILINTR